MINRIKRHPILFALLAIVVVAAVVVGIWAAVSASQRASTPAAQATKAAAQTEVSQTLKRLEPKTKTITSAVAPASEQWWKFMQAFSPKWKLPAWDDLTGSPTSVGAAIFVGPKDVAKGFPDYFGVPTIYLNYPSATAAQSAVKQFIPTADGGDYQAFATGTTLVVIPNFVFNDVLFKNVQQDAKAQATSAPDSALTRGSWQINWKAMDDYFKLSTSEADFGAYKQALADLGYNASASGSWAGYSTDTSHWIGSNFSQTNDSVWDASKSSYENFSKTLNATSIVTGVSSSAPSGRPTKADDPNYTQYSTYVPQQALMLEYLGYANNSKAFGGVRDTETQKLVATSKPTKKGAIRISLDPSAWFGIMRYPDANGFYKTSGFASWTIDEVDSTNMNITVAY